MNARIHQPVHAAQHAPSYYTATLNRRIECPPLAGGEQVNVCVAGGGFSRVNMALELAQRGFSAVLLEAHRIGWGTSGRNDGQLIRGVGYDVGQFPLVIGADGVKALKLTGLETAETARCRVEWYAVDCDLRWGRYGPANRLGDYQGFREGMEELQALDYRHETRLVPAAGMRGVVGSDRYVDDLVDMDSGHLHPLNLILGETVAARSLDIRLFERSPVTRIDYGTEVQVRTATGKVRTKTLVLGCNAYMDDLSPLLDGKMLPADSYVIAAESSDEQLARQLLPQNIAIYDQRVALGYYRLSADSRPLLGDACYYPSCDPSGITACMRPKILEVFPQLANARIDYQRDGMVGTDANCLSQIGCPPERPNVHLAQAYSGHGANATHLAGQLLIETIGGQQSGGFNLFAKMPHTAFPDDKLLRSPLLTLGMAWYRLEEKLGS